MGKGEAFPLSRVERAVLSSLHTDGPANVIMLVGRLRPRYRPHHAMSGVRAGRGIETSLGFLRCLERLVNAGFVFKDDSAVFSITTGGRIHLHRADPVPQARSWITMVGAFGLVTTLSSCSTFRPTAVEPVKGPDVELAMSYELQQFRGEDGAVGFRACSLDCAQPTLKTLAVARVALPTPAAQRREEAPPAVAAAIPAPTAEPLQLQLARSAPAALYRVYFRFGTAEFGPGALQALSAALPTLKTMDRIDVAAGADPIGTRVQNRLQIQLRQEAVKAYLVRHGVDASRIFLVQGHADIEGVQVKGMEPRRTIHAEMRRADILARAGGSAHAAR